MARHGEQNAEKGGSMGRYRRGDVEREHEGVRPNWGGGDAGADEVFSYTFRMYVKRNELGSFMDTCP